MGDTVGKVADVATLGLLHKPIKNMFEGPDTGELDAMYMQQARETEDRIKRLRANIANKRETPVGVRSGSGTSVQGVPTLTNIAQATGKTKFGE